MQKQVSGLYLWPFDASLRAPNTALIIVDMQVDYCGSGGWLDQIGSGIENTRRPIEPLARVLAAMRDAGFSILHTREGYRRDLSDLNPNRQWRSRRLGLGIGDEGKNGRILVRDEPGWQIIPELAPRPGEPVIDKPGISGFHASDFDQILRRQAIRNLVISGVTTDYSVQSTLRDANDRGYECLLLEDCCAALDMAEHEATLNVLRLVGGHYGSITTSRALLEALH